MERGSEVKGFISAPAVGTPGVPKKKKKERKENAKKKRQNAAQHIEDQSSVHNETHTCGE